MRVLLWFAGLVLAQASYVPSSRIIGGQDADADAWPWQLALYIHLSEGGSSFCGASLIDAHWAMTAAHCVADHGLPANVTEVCGGTVVHSEPTNAQCLSAKSIHVHPDWDEAYENEDCIAHVNDIALIELDGSFILDDFLNLAKIDTRNEMFPYVGEVCTISGWGLTNSTDHGNPDHLQEANDTVHDPDGCELMYRDASITVEEEYPNNVQGPGQVCIYNGVTGSCSGDSGGPMSCFFNGEWLISGVTSYGVIGCPVTYPSTYTRVSYYCQWIENTSGLELGDCMADTVWQGTGACAAH